MKKFILLFPLLLIACDSKIESITPSTNSDIKVSVLTRFDGITLYRVEVDRKYVYVARTGKVNGEALDVSSHWTETVCYTCGKSTCCKEERKQLDTVVAKGK